MAWLAIPQNKLQLYQSRKIILPLSLPHTHTLTPTLNSEWKRRNRRTRWEIVSLFLLHVFIIMYLCRNWLTFSIKGHIVNSVGFVVVGLCLSYSTLPMKAAIKNTETTGHGCVLIKLYRNRRSTKIFPSSYNLWTSAVKHGLFTCLLFFFSS